jgi:hypothetical protein
MQMSSGSGEVLARAAGEQVFLGAQLRFVTARLLPELEDQLLGVLLEGLGQAERYEDAEQGERAEEDHHWEVVGEAEIDDFGGEDDYPFSHEGYNTGADHSGLSGENLVLIDIEDGELEGNGQLEEEDKRQYDDLYVVLDLLTAALLPDEDQHECTGPRHCEAYSRDNFSPRFRDHKLRSHVGCNLGEPDGESVDVEIELELIEHEAGGVEAEADDAEEEDEEDGGVAGGGVLE